VRTEGTLEAAVALDRVSVATSYADAAVLSLLTTTKSGTAAPAGADHGFTGNDASGEYHAWPASAAASWGDPPGPRRRGRAVCAPSRRPPANATAKRSRVFLD